MFQRGFFLPSLALAALDTEVGSGRQESENKGHINHWGLETVQGVVREERLGVKSQEAKTCSSR